MDVDVLGPLRLDGGSVRLPPRDRMFLTAMAVRVGYVLTIDELTDVLWHDSPPPSAPKVVQGCVARLRKVIGPSAVETTSSGYRLTGDGVRIDSAVFVSLLTQSRDQRVAGDLAQAAGTLGAALRLWRGRPFVDITEWAPAEAEAARLTELRLVAEEDLAGLRLDLGDQEGVAADALTLSAAEPWRERRWVLLALAQYRCGRQTDALATIRRAGHALRTELGVDPGPELTSLEESVLKQDPSLLAPAAVSGPYDESCPYKGLAAYGVGDAALFFGRSHLVAELAARLETLPLLVVAGDSGAGKSSVVRAGLVPLLREHGRDAAILVPTHDPQTAVAATLGAAASDDPLLVIDQFEEIFTQEADVASWLSWVVEYATSRAPVVLAIRADHLGGLAQKPELARLVEKGVHLVRPLAGDELREAIEGPARAAGLTLDPGLVDLIVRDVEGEPGGQPLMSHALMEVWHRRAGRTMTLEGYRACGGIRGAVTRSAERLYSGLGDEDRGAVRSIMVRLCPVDDDGRPERTRVALSVFDDPRSVRMVETLVRARLVTATEGQIEVAHEALARTWPRLRRWLGDDAVGRRIFKHLADAAQAWESLGRPESELYRGGRLEIAMDWRAAGRDRLSAVEAAFLDASADQAQRMQHDLTRRNRRLRALLSGVVALLVAALLTGFIAVENSRSARSAERASRHTAIVSQSAALRSADRSLAALLAVEAYREQPDAESRSALMGIFTGSPGFIGSMRLEGDWDHPYDQYGNSLGEGLNGVVLPQKSTAIVALQGKDLRRVNLRSGKVEAGFDPPGPGEDNYANLRVSDDGRYLAKLNASDGEFCLFLAALESDNGSGCATLSVYSLSTRKRVLGPLHPPFNNGDVAISHDGSYVAVAGGFNGDVALYRVRDGKLLSTVSGPKRPDGTQNVRDTATVAFVEDRLYAGSLAGPIRTLAVPSMRKVDEIKAPAGSSNNYLVTLADGTLIASGDDWLVSLDSRTGKENWRADIGTEGWSCPFLAVSDTVGMVYCGNRKGEIDERDLATGRQTGNSREPPIGGSGDLAISADGLELVAFSEQAVVMSRWRLDESGFSARLTADGKHLLVNTHEGVRQVLLAGENLLIAACQVAGRNLTRAEWKNYLGTDSPYRKTCQPYRKLLFVGA